MIVGFKISNFNLFSQVQENDEKKLKYLEFVQVAAVYIVVLSSALYEYAKENSGPLKPGVETVEGTVKAVIGPVYDKFQDVPFELLKFVDRKVRKYFNSSLTLTHRRTLSNSAHVIELDHVMCRSMSP